MAILFQASGIGWRLEIIGKRPELPPFLKKIPSSSIEAQGVTQMARIDTESESLKPISPGELMEPLFYEAVGYDIYFDKDDPSATITLPAKGPCCTNQGTFQPGGDLIPRLNHQAL